MARSSPATIAASTRARASRLSEPWCSPIGRRLVVHRPERLEEELGLGAGVDEDERGARAPRISSITARAA